MNKKEVKIARGNIVKKLDNTSTYESWLIIDTYIEKLEEENKQLKEKAIIQEAMIKDSVSKDQYKKIEEKLEVGEEQYNDLVEEKEEIKKQLDYLRSGEYFNQLRYERDLLQNMVQDGEVPKEDKEFLDMTHRNTELIEENKQQKEKIDNAINNLKESINYFLSDKEIEETDVKVIHMATMRDKYLKPVLKILESSDKNE